MISNVSIITRDASYNRRSTPIELRVNENNLFNDLYINIHTSVYNSYCAHYLFKLADNVNMNKGSIGDMSVRVFNASNFVSAAVTISTSNVSSYIYNIYRLKK